MYEASIAESANNMNVDVSNDVEIYSHRDDFQSTNLG